MIRIVAVAALVVAAGMLMLAGRGDADRSAPAGGTTSSVRACLAVISCGTKNGKRKEYATPCAAEDDGATDIKPLRGPACDGF